MNEQCLVSGRSAVSPKVAGVIENAGQFETTRELSPGNIYIE